MVLFKYFITLRIFLSIYDFCMQLLLLFRVVCLIQICNDDFQREDHLNVILVIIKQTERAYQTLIWAIILHANEVHRVIRMIFDLTKDRFHFEKLFLYKKYGFQSLECPRESSFKEVCSESFGICLLISKQIAVILRIYGDPSKCLDPK